MSEAQEIVALFQRAEQMIIEYCAMMENARQLMLRQLRDGILIPEQLEIALFFHPDMQRISGDPVTTMDMFLQKAIPKMEQNRKGMFMALQTIRGLLAATDVLNAKNSTLSWSLHTERSMEGIINEDYTHSDILPPPFYYWEPILEGFSDYFPYTELNSEYKNKIQSVAHYLRTVENPWAKYATE